MDTINKNDEATYEYFKSHEYPWYTRKTRHLNDVPKIAENGHISTNYSNIEDGSYSRGNLVLYCLFLLIGTSVGFGFLKTKHIMTVIPLDYITESHRLHQSHLLYNHYYTLYKQQSL